MSPRHPPYPTVWTGSQRRDNLQGGALPIFRADYYYRNVDSLLEEAESFGKGPCKPFSGTSLPITMTKLLGKRGTWGTKV